MSIHLHIDHDSHKEKETILHLMPCKICADEPANVSSYFNSYIRKINDEYYSSSFRGYLLQGKKVNIPSGYKGVTFSEEKQDDTKNVERNFYSTGMFSQFTYWNYDKIPSENDALVAAFDWIDIAEALHSTNT